MHTFKSLLQSSTLTVIMTHEEIVTELVSYSSSDSC